MLSKSCTQCTLALSVWLLRETGPCILSSRISKINKVASRGHYCQFWDCYFTVGQSFACHQQWENARCKPVLDVVVRCVCTLLGFASPEGWLLDVFHHPTCPLQCSCPEVNMLCTSAAACQGNQWLGLVTSLFLCCECKHPASSPPLIVPCCFFSLWCPI